MPDFFNCVVLTTDKTMDHRKVMRIKPKYAISYEEVRASEQLHRQYQIDSDPAEWIESESTFIELKMVNGDVYHLSHDIEDFEKALSVDAPVVNLDDIPVRKPHDGDQGPAQPG